MATASTLTLKPQTGTGGRTLYATWVWDTAKYKNTKEYSIQFRYTSGDGVWFSGSDETTALKNATYSPPENATKARFRVRPISSTYTTSVKSGNSTKNVTKNYWTADWSSWKEYDIRVQKPDNPPVPTITVNDNFTKFTATCDVSISNSNVNAAKTIEFYIYGYNLRTGEEYRKNIEGNAVNSNGRASVVFTMTAGYKYLVRCRAKDAQGDYSAYSNYTDDWTYAKPLVPAKGIHTCKAISPTQINIDWDREGSAYADTYCIEYTTNKSYFDVSSENVKSVTELVASGRNYYIFTGLESGYTYYFRLRLEGGYNNGYSDWTPIVSATVGKKPAAPTTWALSTVGKIDDELSLYWTHNAQDNASLTYSQIEITTNSSDDSRYGIITIKNSTNEDLKDKTNSIIISTADGTIKDGKTGTNISFLTSNLSSASNNSILGSGASAVSAKMLLSMLSSGGTLLWRVRTCGVIFSENNIPNDSQYSIDYGDWSILRSVTLFAPPTLDIFGTITYNDLLREELISILETIKTTAANWPDEQDAYGAYDIFSNIDNINDLDDIIKMLEKARFDEYYPIQTVINRVCTNKIINFLSNPDTDEIVPNGLNLYQTLYAACASFENDIYINENNIQQYPFVVKMNAGPESQHAIRYFLSIMAKEPYETYNSDGSIKMINEGSIIYSEYIDGPNNEISLTLDPSKLHLENGIKYQIKGLVSMSSGLTAESAIDVIVNLNTSSDEYEIIADVAIDYDNLTAMITPRLSKYLSGEISYDNKLKDNLINAIKDIITYVSNLEPLQDSLNKNILDNDGNPILVSTITNSIPKDISLVFHNKEYREELEFIVSLLSDGELTTLSDLQNIEEHLYNSVIISALPKTDIGKTLFDNVFEQYTAFESSIEGAYIESYVDDSYFSVYRISADGKFIPIETNVYGGNHVTITDPHPTLNYAKYRIVAVVNATGQMIYTDVENIEIGAKFIAINWNEVWNPINISESANESNASPWEGSLLKLLYNIDVSEEHAPDTELIEYIGREHPVDYYGTQLGESGKWSLEIPADDVKTLYALRRLAVYQGSVYVREPSGIGYWANITVSISQKHCETTIPVSLSIVRVEGGA